MTANFPKSPMKGNANVNQQNKTEICHLVNQMPLSGIQKFHVKESISYVVGENIVVKAEERRVRAGDIYQRIMNGRKLLYLVVIDFTTDHARDLKLVLIHDENTSPGITCFSIADLKRPEFKYAGRADFSGWLLED